MRSNHSKGIRSLPMQIQTIKKAFKTFESKFEPYKRDSRNSNQKSNHSKGIQSIRQQIRTLQTRFKPFESKFKPFESSSKRSNANSNHSKGNRSTQMQMALLDSTYLYHGSNSLYLTLHHSTMALLDSA